MAKRIKTPEQRWEQGINHDPRSVALYKSIADIDYNIGDDVFGWKAGGDGDNGEELMYLLDVHFEREDVRQAAALPQQLDAISVALFGATGQFNPVTRREPTPQ